LRYLSHGLLLGWSGRSILHGAKETGEYAQWWQPFGSQLFGPYNFDPPQGRIDPKMNCSCRPRTSLCGEGGLPSLFEVFIGLMKYDITVNDDVKLGGGAFSPTKNEMLAGIIFRKSS